MSSLPVITENIKYEDLSDYHKKEIKNNWFHSYKTSMECKYMNFELYKNKFNIIIDSILTKENMIFDIITWDEILVGWIAKEKSFLHYFYVKKLHRKSLGDKILTLLKKQYSDLSIGKKIECTFIKRHMIEITNEKLNFNPFIRFKKGG